MTTTHRILTLALTLNLGGCVAVIGGGNLETEVRSLPEFQRVHSDSFVRVDVTLGAVEDAELTCDGNLLDRIVTEVVDGTLTVRERRGFGVIPTRKCTLQVSTLNLVEVTSSGSGGLFVTGQAVDFELAAANGSGPVELDMVTGDAIDLQADGSGRLQLGAITANDVFASHDGSGPLIASGVDVDTLRLDHDGSGAVELSGRARLLVLDTDGSGGVLAGDLVTEDVEVDADGSGRVEVNASGTVAGTLSGSGSLTVFGGAAIDVITSGSGRVIRE